MAVEPSRQDRSLTRSTPRASAAGPRAEPLGPDSLTWALGFDRRALLLSGRALVMQVAHPVVGAGVADFSTFRTDPWGRMDRTLRSLQAQLFGGPDATVEADRLRRLHAGIKGVGFDKERYRALDPEAQAWVHFSNLDTVLVWHRRFGRPLDDAEQTRLVAEWCQVGLVLGVRPRYMPRDVAGLHAYVDHMVKSCLGDNPTVRDVLGAVSMASTPPPPWAPLAGGAVSRLAWGTAWALARPIGSRALNDATVGTLPAGLRHKLGLGWSARQERRLDHLAGLVRHTAALIPDRLAQYPRAYQAQQAARAYQAGMPRPQRAKARPADQLQNPDDR